MGQQQLLLLVLGIVIVGLAVVVGINAFGENQKRANADALINDGLRIASDVQAYALKPRQFAGAGGFNNIEIDASADFFKDQLGYQLDSDGNYSNVNGTFTISKDGSDVIIIAVNDDQSNAVGVQVTGVTSREINTEVNYEGDANFSWSDAPDDPEDP